MVPLRILLVAFKASPKAALAALWASVRGLRVRSRNIIYAAAQQNAEYYPLWISAIEPGKIEAYCGKPALSAPPIVAVVLGRTGTTIKDAARTVRSIRAMSDGRATIYCDLPGANAQMGCPALPPEGLAEFLKKLSAEVPDAWLLPLMAGDEVARSAGTAIARALEQKSDATIIYWDEDHLDGRRRHGPWLKPEWDELLFLARDYLTGAGMFKVSALLAVADEIDAPVTPQAVSQSVISLVSRANGNPVAAHIPLILSHRKPGSTFATSGERTSFLNSFWREPVELTEIEGLSNALRPKFMTEPRLPKVSVIVPTRNRDDLLRVCMAGLSRLEYGGEVEIIVIDNESDEKETQDYLAELAASGVTVTQHHGPFNFSAMNNEAAKAAGGELLCFLNNDIEMHDGSWLEAMVRHALRPGVGAVGALLQYPDGTVQHAGVTVGTGNAAGHVYRGTPIAETGHRDMHRLTRRVTAVTAACLVVRRETFLAVGGFDETAFKVAFNDVDLCLRLAERGFRNIFAAEARLTHHESKSRGSDFSADNVERYSNELATLQERWGTKEFIDPFHHPLAMRSSEKFVLGS